MKKKETEGLKTLDLRENIRRSINVPKVTDDIMDIARKLVAIEEEEARLSSNIVELSVPAINSETEKHLLIGDKVLVMAVGIPKKVLAELCTVEEITAEGGTVFKTESGELMTSDIALIVKSMEDAEAISKLMSEIIFINVTKNQILQKIGRNVSVNIDAMYNFIINRLDVESIMYFGERDVVPITNNNDGPIKSMALEHRFIRKDGTYVHGNIEIDNAYSAIEFVDTGDVALLTPEDLANGEIMSVIDFAIQLNGVAPTGKVIDLFMASLVTAFKARNMIKEDGVE